MNINSMHKTIDELLVEEKLIKLRQLYAEYRAKGDETMMKITERRAKALKKGLYVY